MSVAPRIIVKMTADVSQIKKAMQEAQKSVSNASKNIKNTMTGMNKSLQGNKTAWNQLAQTTKNKTTEIGRSANNIGKSIDQQASKVAKASSAINKSLGTIGTSATKAGVEAGNFASKTKSSFQGLEKSTTNAFGGMKKVQTAFKVFMGGKLLNSLTNSAEKIRTEQLAFANVFGETSEYASERLEDLASNIGKLPQRLKPTYTLMTMVWTGMGKTMSEAMELVEKQTMLATDAAGFFGLGVEEANRAMSAWVKGNTASGFALGLTAHQADIAAWYARTLAGEWNNLDNEGRKLVRLQFAEYFYRNAGVLGFASQNSANLADATGNLRAQWTLFMAELGTPLLSAKISILDQMTGALRWLTDGITEGEGAWRVLQGTMDAVGWVIEQAGNHLGGFALGLAITKTAMVAKKIVMAQTAQGIASLNAGHVTQIGLLGKWTNAMAMSTGVMGKTKATMALMSGGFKAMTTAVKATTIGVKALKAVKTFGLSLAIPAVIGGFQALLNWGTACHVMYTELREETDRLTDGLENLGTNLERSTDRFNNGLRTIYESNQAHRNYLNTIVELSEREDDSVSTRERLRRATIALGDELGITKQLLDDEGNLLESSIEYMEKRIEQARMQDVVNHYQERTNQLLSEEIEIVGKLADVAEQRDLLNQKYKDGYINSRQLNSQLTDLAITYDELEGKLERNAHQQGLVADKLEYSRQALLEKSLAMGDYQLSLESMNEVQLAVFESLKESYSNFADVASNRTSLVLDKQSFLVQRTNADGEAIAGSYYSMAESLRQTTNSMMDTWEANIVASENWGRQINAVASRDFGEMEQSVVDHMVRMAEDCIEMAHMMYNATGAEWSRMKALAEREFEAPANAMNAKLGEGYEELISLTSQMVGSELPDTLANAVANANFPTIGAQIPEDMAEGVEAGTPKVFRACEEMAEGAVDTVANILGYRNPSTVFIDKGESIPKSMAQGIQNTKNVLEQALEQLNPLFENAGRNSIQNLERGMAEVKQQVTDTVNRMMEAITRSVENGAQNLDNVFETMGSNMQRSVQTSSQLVSNEFSNMQEAIMRTLNRLPDIASNAMDGMNRRIQSGTNTVNRTLRTGNATMNSTMRILESDFHRHGVNAMNGLQAGLNARRGALTATANSIANGITQTMQRALRVNSPSRVMATDVGRPVIQGIVLGISSNADKVRKEMLELSEIISGTMETNVASPVFNASDTGGTSEEVSLLREQVRLLTAILDKNTQLILNRRVIGEELADDVQFGQNRRSNQLNAFNRGGIVWR